MYKSKAEKEDERWMLESDAIQRIMAADECSEADAREQLEKLKRDTPVIVRLKPEIWFHSPASRPQPDPAEPPQVLKLLIERYWPLAISQAAAAPTLRPNRRGPKPNRTNEVVAAMVARYAGNPQQLAVEKQETLANGFGVSRDTVAKARKLALEILRQDSGKTPIIDN